MESFSFEFGRIFHEAVFVEWFACLWARTDTTHDAPLLVTLVILNRHWVVKVQTICQGLQCNIRKTLMMAYCRDNGNYCIIHQHNLQVSILWFHYKTRMHSSRMHTARSRSRRGGLHQAPPRTRHNFDTPPDQTSWRDTDMIQWNIVLSILVKVTNLQICICCANQYWFRWLPKRIFFLWYIFLQITVKELLVQILRKDIISVFCSSQK